MVKNDIYFYGVEANKTPFFPKKICPKNVPMPSMSRIDPFNSFLKVLF